MLSCELWVPNYRNANSLAIAKIDIKQCINISGPVIIDGPSLGSVQYSLDGLWPSEVWGLTLGLSIFMLSILHILICHFLCRFYAHIENDKRDFDSSGNYAFNNEGADVELDEVQLDNQNYATQVEPHLTADSIYI